MVQKKLHDLDIISYNDQIFSTFTGYFHFTKRFLLPIVSPYLNKISKGVDTVYNKTETKNSAIFKKIIAEVEELDDDVERRFSTFYSWNKMTRKAFYLLALKFFICLYEYDTFYKERADYLLKRILEHKDEFYIDEVANPKNWYPHGNQKVWLTHLINSRKK